MFPIRDRNPSGKTPFVTYIILTINVLVFGYTLTLPEAGLIDFVETYSVIPAKVSAGYDLLTLLTSMFMHASLGHIIGNMLFLHIFGDNLEDRLGHVKYLVFYLVCGLCASVLQVYIGPYVTVPNLGASGAIAGLMGGYLLLFPKAKIDTIVTYGFYIRHVSVPAYFMLFYWFVAQLFSGAGSLVFLDQARGGVAYFAHIGGFAAGVLMIFPYKNRLSRVNFN